MRVHRRVVLTVGIASIIAVAIGVSMLTRGQFPGGYTFVCKDESGWNIVLFHREASDRSHSSDRFVELDRASPPVAVIHGQPRDGWAMDLFYVRRGAELVPLASTQSQVFSDRMVTMNIDGEERTLRLFYIGRTPPSQSLEDPDIASMLRQAGVCGE